MRILALRFQDGSVTILDTPPPALVPGCVRVHTRHSAVSPGTEGTKIITGQKSLLGKAKARPDQVRQVLEMVRSVGLKGTLQKVRSKLDGAQPLGYSLSGVVTEIGPGVTRFAAGDLVACAGGGYANHADEVVVPENLVAKVPAGVSAEDAALTTLGAIALQGVRLAAPTLGENAVVIGLGVIGLLAAQLLRAAGCRVFGADISPQALAFAHATDSLDAGGLMGAEPVEAMIADFSRGPGADLVLICAGAASNEPIELAGRISRKRGRVVVVGAVGMDVPREDYYRKEIALTISCSYGPGRYDPTYEEQGLDYPYAFVRWTEGRNLEAVLDLIATGKLTPARLVTHRFPFAEAPSAYRLIADRKEPYAGILLDYPPRENGGVDGPLRLDGATHGRSGSLGLGVIGAGSYAQAFLLPPLKSEPDVHFTSIFTRTGLSAADVGRRLGFARAVGSLPEVLADPDTAAVVVATRHDQHGPAVLAALAAGKHVFVEKPLCLTREELGDIARRLASPAGTPVVLQVGFNRRFSPAARAVKAHFGARPGPLTMIYRVNAGAIPRDHWIQDPREGGGRLVGEVCHFVDLMQFIAGADPVEVFATCIGTDNAELVAQDNVLITLRFADGSVGTLAYVAQGAKSVAKELFEVHGAGRSAILDNFGRVALHTHGRRVVRRVSGKGQAEEIRAFIAAIRSGQPAIAVESQLATTLATFDALESLRLRAPVRIDTAALLRRP